MKEEAKLDSLVAELEIEKHNAALLETYTKCLEWLVFMPEDAPFFQEVGYSRVELIQIGDYFRLFPQAAAVGIYSKELFGRRLFQGIMHQLGKSPPEVQGAKAYFSQWIDRLLDLPHYDGTDPLESLPFLFQSQGTLIWHAQSFANHGYGWRNGKRQVSAFDFIRIMEEAGI